MNTLSYKGYVGSVEVSLGNDNLWGKVLGIDDIVAYEGNTIKELRQSFKNSIDEYLSIQGKYGIAPTKPISPVTESIDLFSVLSDTEKNQSKLRGILAAAITNKRHKLGLLQENFAKKFDIPKQTLVGLENAELDIGVNELISILEKIDINYSIVIEGSQITKFRPM